MSRFIKWPRMRIRYSVAILLAFVTFLSVLFAFVRMTDQKYRRASSSDEAALLRIREFAVVSDVERELLLPCWFAVLIGRMGTEDEYFRCTSIQIKCSSASQDERRGCTYKVLKYASNLDALTELKFDLSYCDDECACYLSRLSELREIDLSYSEVTDKGVSKLRTLTKTRSLRMHSCRGISDDGIRFVAAMPDLESLDLSFTRVSDDGLRYLAGLERLKQINLGSSLIDGSGLPCEQLPSLEAVTVETSSDRGLRNLAKLPSLNYLDVSGDVSAEGLKQLNRSPKLSRLVLETDVDDDKLRAITSIATLESLHLTNYGGRGPTNSGVRSLAELPKLRVLMLSGFTQVTTACLKDVAQVPTLQRIEMSVARAEADDIEHFESVRPNVEIVIDDALYGVSP